MAAPFTFAAEGRFQPYRPWFYVTDQGWSVIRIVPNHTVQILCKGRGSEQLIDVMIGICATAIVLNRIMGRPDFYGVPKYRGI